MSNGRSSEKFEDWLILFGCWCLVIGQLTSLFIHAVSLNSIFPPHTMSKRPSLSWPITLGVIMIVLIVLVIVGWVLMSIFGALATINVRRFIGPGCRSAPSC